MFYWLQEWSLFHWNRQWHNSYGISIRNVDNPGWLVEINLEGTVLKGKDFTPIIIDRTEKDWIYCQVNHTQFQASCGGMNLIEILQRFEQWDNSLNLHKNKQSMTISDSEKLDKWIQKWYLSNCNGDWEHFNEVKIHSLIDSIGWKVEIDLEETFLEKVVFKKLSLQHSDDNWLKCQVKNRKFCATGGCRNLVEILKIFQTWAINSAL
jgi:hypothetical protein